MLERIVIVGAGQAGASMAARLRAGGFDGEVVVLGAEPHLPYQRPPLSKRYLSGEWALERLHLRPEAHWKNLGVTLRLGAEAKVINRARRVVEVAGEQIAWSKLGLATGAAPRPKPRQFAGLRGVHDLRTLGDVDALRADFRPGRRLLILGGGFIGLETAAVAAEAGLVVTVVELAPRILERVACAETAGVLRDLHRGKGVRIVEGAAVVRAFGEGSLSAVELDSGEVLEADLALMGIGVRPATALAEDAGIVCGDGVLVDAHGRTSAEGVWAAGDCAAFPLGGVQTRLENVQNAIEQAEAAADDMLGRTRPYAPVPWFWSDQYDVKLQIAGLNRGYTSVLARASGRGRSHWYFRDDDLIAVDAINDGRAFMAAKRLLENGVAVSRSAVLRPDFDPVGMSRAAA